MEYGEKRDPASYKDASNIISSMRKYAVDPSEGYSFAPWGEHRQYVREYTYTKYVYSSRFCWWDKWEDGVVYRLREILKSGELDHMRKQVFQVLNWWLDVYKLGWGYVLYDAAKSNPGGQGPAACSEQWAIKELMKFQEDGCVEGIWFCHLILMGKPQAVSDFHVQPKYAVVNEFSGSMVRYVVLENMRGEKTEPVPLDAADFVSPEKFRRWIAERGRFTFGVGNRGGITELNRMQLDVNSLLHLFTVTEFSRFGWQQLPHQLKPKDWDSGILFGVWVFRDGMLFPDSQFLRPNKDGVVSWSGQKFRVADCGPDGQGFKLTQDPKWSDDITASNLKYEASDGVRVKESCLSEKDHLRGFFVELCKRLKGTFGTGDWMMLLGGLLGYAVAPEVFKKRHHFPGIFVHGQQGSGKSYVVQWLMDLYGFDALDPLQLRGGGVTEVGLEQAVSQYSNIALWADEFAVGEVSDKMVGVFRNAFNRGGVAKHGLGGEDRRPSTMFILSGENTPSDAAMRSRYAHVFISVKNRKQENRDWFESHRKYFVLIWRAILCERKRFLTLWYDAYDTWLKWCAGAPDTDPRAHFVYGMGWAALESACRFFGAYNDEILDKMRRYVIESMVGHNSDVNKSTRSNVFWTELVTAVDTRDVELDWLDVQIIHQDAPADAPDQKTTRGWDRAKLYFVPSKVRDGINRYRRARGFPPMMEITDLRAQMKPYEFFDHRCPPRRFGRHSKAAGVRCWCVDLDKHDLGYVPLTNAEFAEWVESGSSHDPRRGELYGLVDKWLHFRAETEREDQQQTF